MYIISLSGLASSGKDAAADFLVSNHNFCKIALADEIKRIIYNLYPYITKDHLWGSSEMRATPIKEYPTNEKTFDNCLTCGSELKFYYDFDDMEAKPYWRCESHGKATFYITSRFACTRLNCIREMYPDTYVDIVMDMIDRLKDRECCYNQCVGLYRNPNNYAGIVIPDNRWPRTDGKKLREAGGILIRMKRGEGLKGTAGKHVSETIQKECPDEYFDYVADNREWSLDQLSNYMDKIVEALDSKSK